MPFRKTLFWIHLTCGLAAGLVILMMCVTGVLLTYEKQMVEWADREHWVPSDGERPPAPLSELLASAQRNAPQSRPFRLVLYSDPAAPVAAPLAGGRTLYLDPYTTELRGESGKGMRSFMHTIKSWHRWFGANGKGQDFWRAVTGWSNVVLLFLVFSGLYLWLPRHWSWPHVRLVMLYDRKARGRARDYNWHNVFGFWMVIPLAVVVASAIPLSFHWASDFATRLAGEAQTPATSPASRPAPAAESQTNRGSPPAAFDVPAMDPLFALAAAKMPGWRTIAVSVPRRADAPVSFRIDRGWGGAPQKQSTVMYDAATMAEVSYTTFEDQPRGRRFRTFLRFAHTGEYYGLWGQTLAGIASLAGVFLVWSGFALAWRRLVRPTLRRRAS